MFSLVAVPANAILGQSEQPPDIQIVSFQLEPNLMVERNYIPASESDMSNQAAHMAKGYLRSRLTVRNSGTRSVSVIGWDYILTDPNSHREVARYHFRGYKVIRPNKKVTLESAVDEARDTPQNRKVSERYKKNQFTEEAKITYVQFIGGMSWYAPTSKNVQSNGTSQQVATPAPRLRAVDTQATSPQVNPSPTPEQLEENDTLKIDTRLVTVPLVATDSTAAYVPDLTADEIKVYEDGVQQQISAFDQVSAPFLVVLLLDTSGSTNWTSDEMKRQAIYFVDRLDRNAYVYVVTFDSDLHPLHSQATNNHDLLRAAILDAKIGLSTRLVDAVAAIDAGILSHAHGRKALVLFTDGGENASVYATKRETLYEAQELDALVYVVHYYPFLEKKFLRTLVDATGGRLYKGGNKTEVEKAFDSLAMELGRQYAVSYYPTSTAVSGQIHSVKVIVARPGVLVRSRKTYKVR
jgi:Ca-activated chloride channel family protein